MHHRPFQQVDVFTATAYRGNPLAVVLDGTGLSTEEMQQFTRWTNLSEATFVLPPTPEGRAAGADYRVRIFYPAGELPFAGHPTLGTCHAWLKAGGQPQVTGRIVQECGVGLVTIRQQGEQLAFAAPPLRRSGPLDEADVALIARGLGVAREDIVQHAWCDNGPGWRAVLLASRCWRSSQTRPSSLGWMWAWWGLQQEAEPPHRVERSAWWAAAMRTASRLKCAPSSLATTVWPKTP